MGRKKTTGRSEFTQEECVVRLSDGYELRFPSHPDPCEYARIVDEDGEEEVYWHYKEFEEDARDVLGALLGAIKSHMESEDE